MDNLPSAASFCFNPNRLQVGKFFPSICHMITPQNTRRMLRVLPIIGWCYIEIFQKFESNNY